MAKKKSYNRMYDETVAEHVEPRDLNPIEPVIDPVIEPVTEEPVKVPAVVTGTVVDCNSLNVREIPDRKGAVLTILMADDEVRVNADEHLDEWYHVYTACGLDGFCMKKYIAVKE